MEQLSQDLRFAVRRVLRHPSVPVTVVLVLGLGIGMNAAIFNLINAMLLRPLPYEDAGRLVAVHESHPQTGRFLGALSVPNYFDWRDESQVFEGIGAYARRNFNASTEEQPERLVGSGVSANMFDVLGVRPALGRSFLPEEDEPGRGTVVILGHSLWEQRFGADPAAIGRTLTLDGEVYEIVGVMPPGFAFPEWAQLWTPLVYDIGREQRGYRWLEAIARLRPGVTALQAESHMAALAQRLEAEHPEANAGWTARVVPLRAGLMPAGPRIGLYLMLAAVGCMLLIVAGNVVALLLAQTAARRQEIALRLVMGANRRRLVHQLLTENVLLAIIGGFLGVLFSVAAVKLMLAAVPIQIPFWIDFSLDVRVLLFTLGLSLFVGILFGLTPALQASRPGQFAFIKEGAGSSLGGSRSRFLKGLVAFEFTLSAVLLVSAMMMATSFLNLRQADPGFDTDRLLTLRLSLTADEHADLAVRTRLLHDVIDRVAALPGVESAAGVEYLPIGLDGYSATRIVVDGLPVERGEEVRATHHAATGGYLDAVRIPILEGRDFTEAEAAAGTPVAVISRSLAQRFWPGESALGRRIRTDRTPDGEWLTVIGVAGSVQPNYQIAGVDSWPDAQVYVPYPMSFFPNMSLVVRTLQDPLSLAPAVRRATWDVGPNVPIYQLYSMDQVIARVLWLPRFWGQIFTAFGLMALFIAGIGIYGVTSYAVTQRQHEMGIRIALGARRSQIVASVLRTTLAIGLAGLGIGLILALATTRGLSAVLYGVSASEPAVYATVAVLLGGTATLATLVPALRIARADPAFALKSE